MNKITYENDPERQEKEVIPGTSDIAFKSIFKRNRELLIELVTGIEDSITKEEMKNFKFMSEEFPKESIEEKGKISDILIEVENKIINIEMDRHYYEKIIRKNNKYINKVQSLFEEKIVVQINIDNYNLYDDKTSIIKFQMMTNESIIDKSFLTKYHVNLEVIKKKYYNKEKLTKTEKFMLMLKLVERKELEKISRGDDTLKNLYEELNALSKDRESILAYSKEELELEAEREEGKKEGFKEGIISIVNNMIQNGFKIEDIVKATGLSIEEIEKLRRENS